MADSRTVPEEVVSTATDGALPDVETSLARSEILARLDVAARRGRIPGLRASEGGQLFIVDGCGVPFEHHLVATLEEREGRSRLGFALQRQAKMPLIFAVLLVVTVWPGVHFMDQLIPGEWGWIPTWTWYLPLTVLPIPWIWRSSSRKSRVMAHEDAQKIIATIREELARAT